MVSAVRVCLVVGVVEPRVLASMGLPALGAAVGFGVCGGFLMIRQAHPAKVEMPARSPFDLGALIFALAFSVVATANAAFAGHVGSRGLIATSAVSGLLDVDVATLSALRLVQTIVTPDAAGRAALAVNSIGKAVLAIFSSPAGFWVPFLTGTVAAVAFGAAAFVFLSAI